MHIYVQLIVPLDRYEGQRDMLYNQTFNLDQVAFAAEGIKDAQQTVCLVELLDVFFFLQLCNILNGSIRFIHVFVFINQWFLKCKSSMYLAIEKAKITATSV